LQFAQANAQTKNCKRASTLATQKEFQNIFSNASKKIKYATHSRHSMTQKLNNDNSLHTRWIRTPAGNRRLAKVAVQYSADTFVVNQNLVLRINICGENRHLRQAPNRYASP
jgi:hypothetical protein